MGTHLIVVVVESYVKFLVLVSLGTPVVLVGTSTDKYN